MRLLSCHLQNVRLHGDLSLSFSPRITLVGGANESGKSTLIEALHRALFLKATVSGTQTEALRSRTHLGLPTITIDFEAKGDIWTLNKRFSGNTGQVSLRSKASGESQIGAVAEQTLAQLVGVEETLGGRQATTILQTRWAHLWVMQGKAGDNLLEKSKENYDFDALLAQLEKSGGAVVQQSSHDQIVSQRIEAALQENFTKRDVRKKSPLWHRKDEFDQAENELNTRLQRLTEYEEAGSELSDITEDLEILQNQKLPALEKRLQLITQSAKTSADLDSKIKLKAKALEPLQLKHDNLTTQLSTFDQLSSELQETHNQLKILQESQESAESNEKDLKNTVEAKRQSLTTLKSQKNNLEQRNQLLQLLSERSRLTLNHKDLIEKIDQLRASARKRTALKHQLAEKPVIGRDELSNLRKLQQAWRDVTTRKQAMSAGVHVLRSDQSVRINGEAIKTGETRHLSSVFQLQVGKGVELEVTPGGGTALDDLDKQCLAAEAAFKACLTNLRVSSLEIAEDIAEQRGAIQQQLLALTTDDSENLEAEEKNLERLDHRLNALSIQLASLKTTEQGVEEEQSLPTKAEDLDTLQQRTSTTLTLTSTFVGDAEKALDQAISDLDNFRESTLASATNLKVAESKSKDLQGRLEDLIKAHGTRDTLLMQQEQLTNQCKEAEEELKGLKTKRDALGAGDEEEELSTVRNQIKEIKHKIETLVDRRGAAKERCNSISKDDPYGAVEQARVQYEIAELEYRSLKRITEAHRLLQKLFMEVQADLSSRYSEPLAQSISTFLRPLIPDSPVVQMSYDQANGFGGLQLQRNGEFYDFKQLSGGMKEQLTAALRLSIADVLKSNHEGCLPLVFDDAFTNSDPERIQNVKQMLGTAADKGLQVILLTCDPEAYGGFAEQKIEL